MPNVSSGDSKRSIDSSIVARVAAGFRMVTGAAKYIVTGVSPSNWFGPNQPMEPIAPRTADAGVEGRQFDYTTGYNLRQTPRGEEAISFPALRMLADSWGVLRTIIETRKDQMVKLQWAIRPKDSKAKPDARCDDFTKFFSMPDGEHNWQSWLRMLLEDLLVIDAPVIYPLKSAIGDKTVSLLLMDGAMFKRVLDAQGRTPMPPSPAYQQVIKNLPAVNYTRDQLIYFPRNIRTWKVYGYSPVEQIVMTVNIALRKEMSQLSYYTYGSTPDLILSTPKEWNPDQIKKY